MESSEILKKAKALIENDDYENLQEHFMLLERDGDLTFKNLLQGKLNKKFAKNCNVIRNKANSLKHINEVQLKKILEIMKTLRKASNLLNDYITVNELKKNIEFNFMKIYELNQE